MVAVMFDTENGVIVRSGVGTATELAGVDSGIASSSMVHYARTVFARFRVQAKACAFIPLKFL
jgi:hypothetical protein